MRNLFCNKICTIFTSNDFTVDRQGENILYAYDCNTSKRTYLTSESEHQDKSLKIINDNNYEVIHICIDGGLIKHGLEDYIGDGEKHGRCDCMIFNDNKLLLVEFKMDVEEQTKDKNKWKHFSDAMKQIREFYLHMKNLLSQNGHEIHTFYANDNIIPIVCMKHAPEIHPKRNVQRNNEKERFRLATDLKIQSMCEFEFQ